MLNSHAYVLCGVYVMCVCACICVTCVQCVWFMHVCSVSGALSVCVCVRDVGGEHDVWSGGLRERERWCVACVQGAGPGGRGAVPSIHVPWVMGADTFLS